MRNIYTIVVLICVVALSSLAFGKDSGASLTQEEKYKIYYASTMTHDKAFQKDVIKRFRSGEIRFLISTSVAEEGIDIGDVDYIICYDITSTSPIKLIQRFGRTGRSSNGNVIVLATKGEEKSKYYRSLKKLKDINKELKNLQLKLEKSLIRVYKNQLNMLTIPMEDITKCEFIEPNKNLLEDDEGNLISIEDIENMDVELKNKDEEGDSLDAISNFASSSSERDELEEDNFDNGDYNLKDELKLELKNEYLSQSKINFLISTINYNTLSRYN